MSKRIRVLVVDDSSVIRTLLTKILSSDSEIEVVGTAPDPYVAREKIVALNPDVMTLDIEMPRMDGVSFLEKVMKHYPIRTLIFSSLSTKNSELALRSMEVGAIDVMEKPAIDVTQGLGALTEELTKRVKKIAQTNLAAYQRIAVLRAQRQIQVPNLQTSLGKTTHQILAIASSTGGTEALKVILPNLPKDLPGTVIVQHMPPVFTKAYAESLQRICPFEVKEAEHRDRILPGRVLIAPGNFHMEVVRSGAHYHVNLHQEPLLHGVRPAADFLMKSVAKYAGANAIGVILTGMGRDGAEGLLHLRKAGGFVIAQNEESCVVYGMPKAAVDLQAVDLELPLDQIASEIIKQVRLRAVV